MSHSAVAKVPAHNHNLRDLNDVDSNDIGDGKTLVWNAALGKHVYRTGGTGSFNADLIVTSPETINGNEEFVIITDNDGNVITEE